MPKNPAVVSIPQPLPARVLQDAASMFALLAATVSLHLLWLLADDDHDVSTLAANTGQSIATVSHHLNKLKLAGLVQVRRDGKRMVYGVADPHVVDVVRLAIGQRLEQQTGMSRRRARRA